MNRVREFRKARSLSQQELGARCGMLQRYVSKIESGETAPLVTTARKLADALGVTIDELFPLEQEREEANAA